MKSSALLLVIILALFGGRNVVEGRWNFWRPPSRNNDEQAKAVEELDLLDGIPGDNHYGTAVRTKEEGEDDSLPLPAEQQWHRRMPTPVPTVEAPTTNGCVCTDLNPYPDKYRFCFFDEVGDQIDMCDDIEACYGDGGSYDDDSTRKGRDRCGCVNAPPHSKRFEFRTKGGLLKTCEEIADCYMGTSHSSKGHSDDDDYDDDYDDYDDDHDNYY